MNRAQKRRQQKLAKTAAKNEMHRPPTLARGQAEGGVSTYDLQGLIQKGIQVHQAGQLPEAEAIYRQILDIEPDHADANHLLGVIADQVGRHEIAVQLISKAIKKNPIDAAYHCNLGNALHELGRLDEAVASYRKALGINPNYLRIAFGVGLMWNPVIVVAAYLALGVAVYVARALYPAYVVADQGETASEATPNNDDNRAPDRLAA